MVTLIIMVAVSMMSAKFATLAFLKLKMLAHAIPRVAQLPRVWTRYSHDYTKPGSGQSRTRDAAPTNSVAKIRVAEHQSGATEIAKRRGRTFVAENVSFIIDSIT